MSASPATQVTTNGSARRSVSSTRRDSSALSVADSKHDTMDYRRVLVLYTGGTIGMVRGDDGGEFLVWIHSLC